MEKVLSFYLPGKADVLYVFSSTEVCNTFLIKENILLLLDFLSAVFVDYIC